MACLHSDKLREDSGRFLSNMKGLLRQGFHVSHDELKLEDAPTKEQGDTTFDRKQKSKALLVEKEIGRAHV